MKKLDAVALILVIVGALNWGLVSIAEFDLVATHFGLEFCESYALTGVVYGLVGAAAVWVAVRAAALLGIGRERELVHA
jgi:uncharacterized membrane protein YuzA (DUF378 family)